MNAVRRAFLLSWRLQRSELVAVALAAVGLAAASLKVAGDLAALVEGCRVSGPDVAPCGGIAELGMVYSHDSQGLIAMVGPLMAALPFAAGVVLGAPALARELEHRTAHLAWGLAPSRAMWLATRLVPIGLLGAALLAVPAMAGEVLVRSLYPVIDPAANFELYGVRGPVLVLRFLPALVAGALVGAVVGRQLPALLVAGALVAGIGAGVSVLRPHLVEAVEQPEVRRPIDTVGSLFAEVRYRDRDGSWIPNEEAWARMAWSGEGGEPDWRDLPREVIFSIPGTRYPDVVVRESALLLVGGGVLGGLLLVAVQRRRSG